MKAKHIAIIVLAGLAVVFSIQNVAVVELRFLFWTVPISGALLMFLILSGGTILGWWLGRTFSRRKSNSHIKHAAVIAE
jgi:putative membrane protein